MGFLFPWWPGSSSGSAAKTGLYPAGAKHVGFGTGGLRRFQALAATLGAELFTARIAFILAITARFSIWAESMGKALAFPLLLLLFMIPIPQILYARLTLSLQFLASQLAESLITLAGIPVIRTGNLLELPHETLNVVEACSGIRSLISLTFLSLVYAYFTDSRVWMRWALLAATIPIAIVANAMRVAITGLLTQVDTELARGFYHEIEGYVVFIIALVSLILVHRMLARIGKGSPRSAEIE